MDLDFSYKYFLGTRDFNPSTLNPRSFRSASEDVEDVLFYDSVDSDTEMEGGRLNDDKDKLLLSEIPESLISLFYACFQINC